MVVSWIDEHADSLGSILSTPGDQIKLIGCLLVSYPLGFIFKRIHNTVIRNSISIALGFFYQYLLYRAQIIHGLILSVLTYFTLKFFGREHAFFLFIVNMLYLSVFNIYRMVTDWGGWKMDIGIVLMIFVCRCTSFAWSYKDGGADPKHLSSDQVQKRIVTLPSLFEFLSFMYFYAGALVGPSYDYNDHEDFIKQQGDYSAKPHTFLPSFFYLITAFIPLAGIVLFGQQYHFTKTVQPEYAEKSWLGKFVFLMISMQLHRFRYFSAWLLANANVTAPGLNYDPRGKTYTEKYGKIVTVRALDYELGDNVRDKFEAWNCPSQLWLKHYVYFRVVTEAEAKKNPGKATFASNVTFMISAFWHGFYPGYYIGFLLMFFLQQISRVLFKIRHRFAWIPEPFGFIIRWTLTSFVFNFAGTTFALLDWSYALQFFKAWAYIPIILLLVTFALLNYTGLGKPPRVKKNPFQETTNGTTPNGATPTAEIKKDK